MLGAVNATDNEMFPGVIAEIVGCPGVVAGVTELDAVEADDVPTVFVAVTVNVYEVPFVKPVNVQEVVVVFTQPEGAVTAGEEVTVYPEIVAPPLLAGAVQETVACALPEVAVTPVGEFGCDIAYAITTIPEPPAPLEVDTPDIVPPPPEPVFGDPAPGESVEVRLPVGSFGGVQLLLAPSPPILTEPAEPPTP